VEVEQAMQMLDLLEGLAAAVLADLHLRQAPELPDKVSLVVPVPVQIKVQIHIKQAEAGVLGQLV
jgi:hypothetical protein